MSSLPASNGEESRVWMDRAHIQADLAEFAADRRYWHEACHHLVRAAELGIKATYIAQGAPVPRKHHIWDLLTACPAAPVREQVMAAFDKGALNRFSGYYFSVYPDGEDADQGAYIRCSQVTRLVLQCVEETME